MYYIILDHNLGAITWPSQISHVIGQLYKILSLKDKFVSKY